MEPLPPNAVVEKNITDVEVVGEAIRRAVKRAQTKNKFTALAVARIGGDHEGHLPCRAICPTTSSPSQIQLEADQYIPYSLDEVNLDFEVIGPSENDPDRVDVLLAASRVVRTSTCGWRRPSLGGLDLQDRRRGGVRAGERVRP